MATAHERLYGLVGVRIVWGNANYGGAMPTGGAETPADYPESLRALIAAGVAEIDTSRVYRQGKAEEWLGQALSSVPGWQDQLAISTKAAPQMGPLTYEGVRAQATQSMALLGVGQIDVYYLHSPDPTAALDEALRALNDLHREGMFRRLGLSNFPAYQVVQAYYICREMGWLCPSVCESPYSASSPPTDQLLSHIFAVGVTLG
jgi:aflatoxin B1 aldehyde reductase